LNVHVHSSTLLSGTADWQFVCLLFYYPWWFHVAARRSARLPQNYHVVFIIHIVGLTEWGANSLFMSKGGIVPL
jgi:hypothetical protein